MDDADASLGLKVSNDEDTLMAGYITKGFIDNFSPKSKENSFSRPVYSDILFKFLSDMPPNHGPIWVRATGNGQAAIGMCKYFKGIIASDASKSQIDSRLERENIAYIVFPAEDET